MPTYKVTFDKPVIYLDGHVRQRYVDHLIVNAPDPTGALFHAIRVVTGDIGQPMVELYDPAPVPPIDDTIDGPPEEHATS